MNLLMAPRKWMVFSAFALLACSPWHALAQSPPAAGTGEAGRVIEMHIVARKAVGGVRTIRALRGETIVLKILSDEKMSIHVHGYDAHQDVTPGSVASLSLVARWVGRFPVTAHLSDATTGRHGAEPTLLYLEVHPE
jgi:hypothetical protein